MDEKKPRTLEEVCDAEDFHTTICGITYCKLAMSKHIGCSRQSEFPDKNGLYPCLSLRYTQIELKYEH